MAFVANRDMKVEAAQADDGSFVLRTAGLAARKRAELEMVGVPEAGLRAAAVVLNETAEYAVNRAEILPDQNVGFALAVSDDEPALMLVVHTVHVEGPASRGLWQKLTGGGKGVLRLVDIGAEKTSAPLTAIATMLVHRARARLAKDDAAGAREELEAAIGILPGVAFEEAGPEPGVATGASVFNRQNHQAYLALAKLLGDDGGAAHYEEALRRSRALARSELGGTFAELAAVDDEAARSEAARIVATNFAERVSAQPGPTPANVVVASPVWEVAEREGGLECVRRAAMVPGGYVTLYYEGAAAEGLRQHGAELAARVFAASREDPARLVWRHRSHREVWSNREAATLASLPYHPASTLLSLILVAIGRGFRAGATPDEVVALVEGREDAAVAAKLAALDAWETEQLMSALGV